MNFSDCVLNYIFFTSALVMTMEIHHCNYSVFGRSLDHLWSPETIRFLCGHPGSSLIFSFSLQSIAYVLVWPVFACSKFCHENIAKIYSLHVLTFGTSFTC